MSDLAAHAAHAVERAVAAGATDAEAYASEAENREVRVHGGEVESLTAATQRGLGLRVWIGGRVGYGFGTDLSPGGLGKIAARAVEAARVADEDEFAGAPGESGERPRVDGITDPSRAEWSPAEIADLALAVERSARADPRVVAVEQAVYFDSGERVAIASSSAPGGEYEATSCYAYLQALAGGEEARETGLGFDLARGPAALDPAAIGREGAGRATEMIGSSKPTSRSCPVVLDPTVAASFVGLLGKAIGADTVQRGRSPLAERLGEEVAGEAFVLRDDGLDPAGFATAPIDAEGTPRRRTALIEGGRLRTFLYDSYTARRGGAASTGSAGRSGYRSPPGVSASNLIVSPGSAGLDELLREAGEGVYINDVAGLHSGVNPVSGDFSTGASGMLITNGTVGSPVRELTIASTLQRMLLDIVEIGGDVDWLPRRAAGVSLVIRDVTMSGA
ncbi:MAG TPA: TldD/PmbA family protein [Solirubrobacterales bacterium]|nr:TldD/PmbA family protein [Solirubrobacterales bacterium]